jgi:hypothetical protein
VRGKIQNGGIVREFLIETNQKRHCMACVIRGHAALHSSEPSLALKLVSLDMALQLDELRKGLLTMS